MILINIFLLLKLRLEVAGFLSLSIIPQISTRSEDFARVAYLCVHEPFRGQKIGQAL
jgi:ribosomal protein S18 acetylase RimI-like enzyme